jgi:hypothetical protein
VGALLEVLVHECSLGGVASRRNWSEAGHVLAELGDEKLGLWSVIMVKWRASSMKRKFFTAS